MSDQQFSLLEGAVLRRQGQADVIHADLALTREFRRDFDEALHRTLAEVRGGFTADDVRLRLPDGAAPHHPNLFGALMSAASAEGLIVHTGRYVRSRRGPRHGGVVAEWRAATTEVAA